MPTGVRSGRRRARPSSPRSSTSCSSWPATSVRSTSAPAPVRSRSRSRRACARSSRSSRTRSSPSGRGRTRRRTSRWWSATASISTLESFSFDLVGCLRVLHHTHRPELMVAELARMTRPGGTILVADQLAPVDPLAAVELNRFERARDPSTTRVLSDGDLRALFDANGLVLRTREGRARAARPRLVPRPRRAARGRSASARRASRLRATRGSSAGTSSHGADEAGNEALDPRGRAVPARDEDLAPVVVDRVEQPLRDERRLGDEAIERPRHAACAAGSRASRSGRGGPCAP